ncbi:heptaprenyl diphosphate synthase component 1 [Bacillus sp. FJAT-47783]|uniref:heptaprenyl diphosphate synthase component 1 n=1 Tax=Bacillus sp. FJAT-47783 TaxID=2922712 RepID=UPI001FAE57DE|nr:heptaprenyl diphosphate synthase component 1 [Bacillus sp. FJAT-47783]
MLKRLKWTRVIGLKDIENTLSSLKEAVEIKLSHPFLAEYIEKPFIDEDKLLLFYAIFREANISEKELENYCTTAMLVQIALDTHDLVGNVKCTEQRELIGRQLTVLAGDYFSGLYYYILANLNDVKMIQTFAMAIKEINEHKIRLYQSKQDVTDMLYSLSVIESSLFRHIGEHFKIASIPAIADHFLTYKRLCNEKQIGERGKSSIFINSLRLVMKKEVDSINVKMLTLCRQWFEKTAVLLESEQIYPQKVKEFILDRLHTIRFAHERLLNKMVEEG